MQTETCRLLLALEIECLCSSSFASRFCLFFSAAVRFCVLDYMIVGEVSESEIEALVW